MQKENRVTFGTLIAKLVDENNQASTPIPTTSPASKTLPKPPAPKTTKTQEEPNPGTPTPAALADLSDIKVIPDINEFIKNHKSEDPTPKFNKLIQSFTNISSHAAFSEHSLKNLTNALLCPSIDRTVCQSFIDTFTQTFDGEALSPYPIQQKRGLYCTIAFAHQMPIALRLRAAVLGAQSCDNHPLPDTELFVEATKQMKSEERSQIPITYHSIYLETKGRLENVLKGTIRKPLQNREYIDPVKDFCQTAYCGIEPLDKTLAIKLELVRMQLKSLDQELTSKTIHRFKQFQKEQPEALAKAQKDGFVTKDFWRKYQKSQTLTGTTKRLLGKIKDNIVKPLMGKVRREIKKAQLKISL